MLAKITDQSAIRISTLSVKVRNHGKCNPLISCVKDIENRDSSEYAGDFKGRSREGKLSIILIPSPKSTQYSQCNRIYIFGRWLTLRGGLKPLLTQCPLSYSTGNYLGPWVGDWGYGLSGGGSTSQLSGSLTVFLTYFPLHLSYHTLTSAAEIAVIKRDQRTLCC